MVDIAAWITALATAITSAVIGFLLAVKKYRHEQLWQEKYRSYIEIISALEELSLWANETYSSNKLLPAIGALEGLSFVGARRAIYRQSRIGGLLISEEVLSELHTLENELWSEDFRADDDRYYYDENGRAEHMAEHAEKVSRIVAPRLSKVIQLARKDLQ